MGVKMNLQSTHTLSLCGNKYQILLVDRSYAIQKLIESEFDQPDEWRTVATNMGLEQLYQWISGLTCETETWLN